MNDRGHFPPHAKPHDFSGLEITPDQITLESSLSQDDEGKEIGQYGCVYRGYCWGTEVAVKIPKIQSLTPQQMEKFKTEVKIMSEISHPNICRFLGACVQIGKLRLVTELCTGGNVGTLLKKQLPMVKKLKIARDVVKGMIFLHQANFIHMDLKPENLLLDEHSVVKICDFGLSEIRSPDRMNPGRPKGTPLYMAPELMRGKGFNEKVDLYSFGVLLWQILVQEPPYSNFHSWKPFVEAVCDNCVRPPIPHWWTPALQALVTSCWDPNPILRPPFIKINDQLLPVIIDYAIQDPLGHELWTRCFLGHAETGLKLIDEVDWNLFSNAFYQILGMAPPSSQPSFMYSMSDDPLPPNPTDEQLAAASPQALEDLLTNVPSEELHHRLTREFYRRESILSHQMLQKLLVSNEGKVTIERFGQILALFGPLTREPNPPFFRKMKEIIPQPWFYGDISKDEAFQLLRNKEPGTFLVRFSSNPLQVGFVISYVHPNKVVYHSRVFHSPGKEKPFAIESPDKGFSEYPNLSSLIYMNSFQLRVPCQNNPSPWTSFFRPSSMQAGGYVTDLNSIQAALKNGM